MLFFTAVFFVTLAGSEVQGKDCSLTLQTDLETRQPLVLGVSGDTLSFVWPQAVGSTGVLRVADGGQLLLACTGPRNFQTTSNEQSGIATCRSGLLTVKDDKDRPVAVNNQSTPCKKNAAASDQVTNDFCGSINNQGIIVEMGFQLQGKPWLNLFRSCHKITRFETLYSVHLVHGESIEGKAVTPYRPSFNRGSSLLYKGVNPESLYSQDKQKEVFNAILGNGAGDRYMSNTNNPENKTNYLARGHLAPDADFVYTTGQKATYYFVNAAPQWQSFNNGNWKALEYKIRSLAAQLATTLRVWTGTYGVLTLEYQSTSKEIYLDIPQNRLPVPEVIWKLVQNPSTNKCTVAIGINNPFLTTVPNPLPIDCQRADPLVWPPLTELWKGYVYYCSFDNDKPFVDFLPQGIDCSGGLLY